MWHGLAYWLGLTNASGVPYLAWSGFVGDLSLVGGIVVIYRHHNCEIVGCHRLGHMRSTGHLHCRHHHAGR